MSRSTGHRVAPHTADLIIEAWAPNRVACLEEAARALVDSFASVGDEAVTKPIPIDLERDDDQGLLVSLLDEIIYAIDAFGSVPVRVILEATENGGVVGFLDVVPADGVETHGSLPKGVSLTDLAFSCEDGLWRCRATIDV